VSALAPPQMADPLANGCHEQQPLRATNQMLSYAPDHPLYSEAKPERCFISLDAARSYGYAPAEGVKPTDTRCPSDQPIKVGPDRLLYDVDNPAFASVRPMICYRTAAVGRSQGFPYAPGAVPYNDTFGTGCTSASTDCV